MGNTAAHLTGTDDADFPDLHVFLLRVPKR
jgi:hypothetical protein